MKTTRFYQQLLLLAALFLPPALCLAQVGREWVKRYSPTSGFSPDEAQAVAVDGSGNVHVTGSASVVERGLDFTTVKYNDDGDRKWTKQYNGPGNGNDVATAVVLDASGNVYVSGRSPGSGTGEDYTTVKYNKDGGQLWVSRYNGPISGNDIVTDIAVDASGNVYVTGRSPGSGSGDDYATIKYGAGGNQLWIARYNGPEGLEDQAAALAVDASGNVFVTGRSQGLAPNNGDMTTLKYNAAGVQQWAIRHNGILNRGDQGNDIALDASGNVYVTGSSSNLRDEDFGNTSDYTTLKYNTSGEQQWLALYRGSAFNSALALAVDASGNVYITGTVRDDENQDFATVKYNAAGVQQWATRYNNGELDNARDVAVDGSGNVYVTGRTQGPLFSFPMKYATIKYNASGGQQWAKIYSGPGTSEAAALGLDASGNIYVTGKSTGSGSFTDFATIKYEPDGDQDWVRRLNGIASGGAANDLAVDGSGNVYVTGGGVGSSSSSDYHTIKYDAGGSRKWERKYNGPDNEGDAANAIATDASGNVYVTGSSSNTTGGDYATIKYGSDGSRKWTKRYSGPGTTNLSGLFEFATAIAVDASGNVYVTGQSRGSSNNTDYATIKYNSSGSQLWVARYTGPIGSEGNDNATAIAVDASGNVYVTGESDHENFEKSDYATVKYNAAGVQQWVARYNGPGISFDRAAALAVDASGNVYVTGRSEGSGTISDYATIKYNAAGMQLWAARYNGPGNGFDESTALALDASGNVFVTGVSVGTGDSDDEEDYATIKYNTAGVPQWVARYDNGYFDRATALALDGGGNVYVTGASDNTLFENSDYATVKYNAAGLQQWADRFNGTGNNDDVATSIAVDGKGKVYVTGRSIGPGGDSDFLTIKYAQPPAAITRGEAPEQLLELPARFGIAHFPNPVSATARIQYHLPFDAKVSLKVYDELGREVATLVNATANRGTYIQDFDASTLPKGVYYYRITLQTENKVWVETKKMTVVR